MLAGEGIFDLHKSASKRHSHFGNKDEEGVWRNKKTDSSQSRSEEHVVQVQHGEGMR
jgi:hypothetical protein